MNRGNLIEQLKYQYRSGGMHIRLIAWNLAVFLLIQIMLLIANQVPVVGYFVNRIFALQSDLSGFIWSPWGLLTSIFSHFGFTHFLFNMIFLFFTGQMFLQFFSGKRLLYTYIFGGILGGIVQILIGLFPQTFGESGALVVGASGSVMAIFIALAVYKPQLKVHLFGIFPVPLFALALLFVLKDLTAIGANDGIAHFVHLGGALFGFLSVRNLQSSQNILSVLINKTEPFIDKIKDRFSGRKMKVVNRTKPMSRTTDEEFNETKKLTQEQIDAILDKISRSGYDSLTKKEKEFLFKQSSK